MVFRSTIAYNRFWNGRGFLNGLQNASMEFMRNVCMFASSEAGWVSALTPWSQPCIAAHPAPTYPQGKDPEKAEALKAKRQTFRRLITQLMLIAALKLRGTLGVPKRSSESDEGAVESPLASSTNVSGWELPAWLVIAQTHPLFTQKDVEVSWVVRRSEGWIRRGTRTRAVVCVVVCPCGCVRECGTHACVCVGGGGGVRARARHDSDRYRP